MAKATPFLVRLPPATHQCLKSLAEEKDVSAAHLVRRALESLLDGRCDEPKKGKQ